MTIQPDGNVDGAGILIGSSNNITLENFTLDMDYISDVKVWHTSNSTQGISISDASNISIKKLTLFNSNFEGLSAQYEYIGTSISLISVTDISIDSTSLSGAGMHIYLERFENVSITNNDFSSLYHGIFSYFGTGLGEYGNGLKIEGNTFTGPWGASKDAIHLIGDYSSLPSTDTFISGLEIRNNVIDCITPYDNQKGIYLGNAVDPILENNKISNGKYGLYAFTVPGIRLESNEISSTGSISVAISDARDATLINNMIYSYGSEALSLESSYDVSVINNSFYTNSGYYTAFLFQLKGDLVTIVNNIFAGSETTDVSLAMNQISVSELIIDNNLISSVTGISVRLTSFAPGGGTYAEGDYDFAGWQALQGDFDANSQSFAPVFEGGSDLHILNGSDYRFGLFDENVTTDIDGDLRSEAIGIDVGADQYCESYDETVELHSCTSYVFDGAELTESGTYTAAFLSGSGCDSLVSIELTIHESEEVFESVTTCEQYEFGDQLIVSSGDYMETFTNSVGCDSVVNLNLTILESSSSEESIVACNSYEWNGITYDLTGTYEYLTVNSSGCDSVAILNLTVNESTSSSADIEVCGSYDWNETTYSTSGSFEQVFTNATGCDSTVVLNLTILEEPPVGVEVNGIILFAIDGDGLTYQWYSCETNEAVENATKRQFTPPMAGAYYVEVSNENCTAASTCYNSDGPLAVSQLDVQILVYPTVVSDYLALDLGQQREQVSIDVISLDGRTVMRQYYETFSSDRILLEVPEGIYLIKVSIDDRTLLSQKIIKR